MTKEKAEIHPQITSIDVSGREVFYFVMSNHTPEENISGFDALNDHVRNRTERYGIIYEVGNTFGNKAFTDRAKDWAKFTKAQGLSYGSAVIGLTGVKKILAKAIKPDMYWANDLEDAKNWLANRD
jgi:hypothetical protein